ncbi:MAG: hypothetical protein KVP17_000993, partial [Porospora cf. gigantea B]|uniref:uncharacterized protein n=2 Tax=Porospora cf. gigantea B TaxID=2853592 RepID=UPI003571878C
TSEDHKVKKLLQLFWEIVDKTHANGELKEEMLLVCNALRNDLMSPNEYVRGKTLRTLRRMPYLSIIQPLLEPIVENLSHHHAYVRRNAVMCVLFVVQTFGHDVLPTASQEIVQLLGMEADVTTRRNAFLTLVMTDVPKAIEYVLEIQSDIGQLGDLNQLVLLDLIRILGNDSSFDSSEVLTLLLKVVEHANSPAVKFAATSLLTEHSNSPDAIRLACSSFGELLASQADNNVKVIILDRLKKLVVGNELTLENYAVDVLRVLQGPSFEIRTKALEVIRLILSPVNCEVVSSVLKKEALNAPPNGASAHVLEGFRVYQQDLLSLLARVASDYPTTCASLLPLFYDLVQDSNCAVATASALALRGLLKENNAAEVARSVVTVFTSIKSARAQRICAWIAGEFADDESTATAYVAGVVATLQPFPLTTKETPKPVADAGVQTVILADGTYGTKTTDAPEEPSVDESLRTKICTEKDHLLTSMCCLSVTRLALKHAKLAPQALLVVANVLRVLTPEKGGPPAVCARVNQCVKALMALQNKTPAAVQIRDTWFPSERDILPAVLESQDSSDREVKAQATEASRLGPDSVIAFRQVCQAGSQSILFSQEDTLTDLEVAVLGRRKLNDDSKSFLQRLKTVQQLTGLNDPVYVEAAVQVHHFDIVLELLVINRTNSLLQNVTLEFSTQRDMKVVDRPQPVTLSAGEAASVFASLKAQASDSGVIFGHVTFEHKGVSREVVPLGELRVELLTAVELSWTTDLAYRTMWQEFEWENKIVINTPLTDVWEFMRLLMTKTKMTVVGRQAVSGGDEQKALQGLQRSPLFKLSKQSHFYAFNLYSRSSFGEDALANVAIEVLEDKKLSGNIRIRTRSQGVALTLGDKMAEIQRSVVV